MKNSNRLLVYGCWFVLSLFYFYQYILRVMPGVIMQEVSTKFSIGPGIIGQFAGIYYIGYTVMHIPLGIMLDRFGIRIISTLFIACACLGLVPLIYSDNWVLLLIGRFLTGVGSSAAILIIFKFVSKNFAGKNFALMVSISAVIGYFGAVFGGGPLGKILNFYSLNTVVGALLLAGLALAATIFFMLPAQDTPPAEASSKNSITSEIRYIFTDYRIFLASFAGGLLIGPLEGFADGWSKYFLTTVYQLSTSDALLCTTLIFTGLCVSSIFVGLIASRFTAYISTTIFCAFGLVATFVSLINFNLNTSLLYPIFFLIGCFSSYQVLILAKVMSYSGPEHSGLASAVCNMIMMIFGYFFHGLIGKIVGFRPYEAVEGIKAALNLIPIAAFVSLFILFHLKNKGERN